MKFDNHRDPLSLIEPKRPGRLLPGNFALEIDADNGSGVNSSRSDDHRRPISTGSVIGPPMAVSRRGRHEMGTVMQAVMMAVVNDDGRAVTMGAMGQLAGKRIAGKREKRNEHSGDHAEGKNVLFHDFLLNSWGDGISKRLHSIDIMVDSFPLATKA